MTRRMVHQIESMHGVLGSRIRPLTGTLRIRFDPTLTRPERLLRAIESAPESLPVETALGEQLPPVKIRSCEHGPGCLDHERLRVAGGLAGRGGTPGWLEPGHVSSGGDATRRRHGGPTGALYQHRGRHACDRSIPALGRHELDDAILERSLPTPAFHRRPPADGRDHPAAAVRSSGGGRRNRGRGSRRSPHSRRPYPCLCRREDFRRRPRRAGPCPGR